MKIFFCQDGVLRLGNNQSDYLIPMKEVQHIFRLPDDFEFFSRFMTNEVIIEEGSTFTSILRCLEPWMHFWSVYTMTELGEYFAFSKKPRIQKEVPYIHEIEFSHYVAVAPTNTHIINNQFVHNSDLLRVLNSEHKNFMSLNVGVNFNIENLYYLRGYSNFSSELNIDITLIPFVEWMNSRVSLRRCTNVIFYDNALHSVANFMDLKINKRNKYNLVFSKDMFNFGARHLEADGETTSQSYSYVEGATIFKFEEFIREFFRNLPQVPQTDNTSYSTIHRECVNIHLSKDYDPELSDFEIEMALSDMVRNSLDRYNELSDTVQTLQYKLQEINQQKNNQAKIVDFKPSNVISLEAIKNKQVNSSLKLEDNNIIELSKFSQVKKMKMPDSITTTSKKGEQKVTITYMKDPNAEMFDEIVNEALSNGVKLTLQSETFPSLPEHKRLMGLVDPLGFDEFNVANLNNPSFKTIEEIHLEHEENFPNKENSEDPPLNNEN